MTDNILVNPDKHRIRSIDAFRCLAVMGVVVYHYYYRFSPPFEAVNHLPYKYEPNVFTQYGYFGVNLFFVISGFVIYRTLQTSFSFQTFILKRIIRIMPTLVMCSMITFLIEGWLYFGFDSDRWLQFLPVFTFLPPSFWNFILQRNDIIYIDGVYWSLFVEMSFYIVSGLIFFFRPLKFETNWMRLTLLLVVIRLITSPHAAIFYPEWLRSISESVYESYITLQLSYWIYFSLGIFFYRLYERTKIQTETFAIVIALSLLELFFLKALSLKIGFVGIIALFLISIYRDRWLSWLSNRFVLWIGIISYPMYLLHEDVGIILINKIAVFADYPAFNKYVPLVVIVLMLLVSALIHSFFEKPIAIALRSKVMTRREKSS